MPLGYLVTKILIDIVQKRIWLVNNAKELKNATVKVPSTIEWLSLDTWKALGEIIIGTLGTFSIFTLGIGLVIIVFVIRFIIIEIFINRSNNTEFHYSGIQKNIIFLVCVIFGACFAATILMQAVMWLPGFIAAKKSQKAEYSLKILTYLRYFCAYVGPALLCGSIIMQRESKKYIHNLIIGSVIFLNLIWLKVTVPYLEKLWAGTSSFFPFAWTTGQNYESYNKNDMYYASVHWVLVVLGLYLFYLNLGYWKQLLLVINLIFIYRYCYFPFNFSFPVAEKQYKEIDEGVDYIIENFDKKEPFYVYDEQNRLTSLYQLYFRNRIIIPYELNETKNAEIVISNTKMDSLMNTDYTEMILGDSGFLYYKSEE